MKQIPFYGNRPDDLSCMLASIRSELEYFTGRTYSWGEMEQLLGFSPNKVAWTVKVWTELAEQGFDIRMIEAFDYRRYMEEGEAYLRAYLKPEELAWQMKNSNLLEIRPLLPRFLRSVHYEMRQPTLADIDQMLTGGYLVTVTLNLNVLNGKPGYSAHMLLVHDKDGDDYICHDPGLPPRENRRVAAAKLWEAMGGEGNTAEVTGMKLGAALGKKKAAQTS